MTKEYIIEGMSCGGCVIAAKDALNKLKNINRATIQLSSPRATISRGEPLSLQELQQALRAGGNFTIKEAYNLDALK